MLEFGDQMKPRARGQHHMFLCIYQMHALLDPSSSDRAHLYILINDNSPLILTLITKYKYITVPVNYWLANIFCDLTSIESSEL